MPGGTESVAPKAKVHVSTIHSSEERIKVFVRVRPLIHRELTAAGGAGEVATRCDPDAKTVSVRGHTGTSTCSFDGVFPPETTQEEVFAQVRDCVLSVTEGFNATCFAYGQTGSGKTYTMFGDDTRGDMYSSSTTTPRAAGIIPRAVRDILAYVRASNDTCTCYVSFMQIYNESVYDLLRDPGRVTSLAVKEDTAWAYSLRASVSLPSERARLPSVASAGDERRAVRATRMNDLSSRSHLCFRWCWNRGAIAKNNNKPSGDRGTGASCDPRNLSTWPVRKSGTCTRNSRPHIGANKH